MNIYMKDVKYLKYSYYISYINWLVIKITENIDEDNDDNNNINISLNILWFFYKFNIINKNAADIIIWNKNFIISF